MEDARRQSGEDYPDDEDEDVATWQNRWRGRTERGRGGREARRVCQQEALAFLQLRRLSTTRVNFPTVSRRFAGRCGGGLQRRTRPASRRFYRSTAVRTPTAILLFRRWIRENSPETVTIENGRRGRSCRATNHVHDASPTSQLSSRTRTPPDFNFLRFS